MPIYEYRCENGHNFDVFRSMSDDPVSACEECGAAVERVFNPVAVHFKGSGFYTTDYARKGASSEGTGSSAKKEGADKKASSEKKDSKKTDSKGSDSKKSSEKAKTSSD